MTFQARTSAEKDMIALKCPHCGRETTWSPEDLRDAVPCVRCGRVSASALMRADHMPATLQSPPPDSNHASPLTPPSNSNTDPTLAAPGIKPITSFEFLAPAQSPDELGWLAHYKIVRLLGQGGHGGGL